MGGCGETYGKVRRALQPVRRKSCHPGHRVLGEDEDKTLWVTHSLPLRREALGRGTPAAPHNAPREPSLQSGRGAGGSRSLPRDPSARRAAQPRALALLCADCGAPAPGRNRRGRGPDGGMRELGHFLEAFGTARGRAQEPCMPGKHSKARVISPPIPAFAFTGKGRAVQLLATRAAGPKEF